jgi:hypothetical protein
MELSTENNTKKKNKSKKAKFECILEMKGALKNMKFLLLLGSITMSYKKFRLLIL